jgi:hypothetical protein
MASWKKILTSGDVGSGMSFSGTDGNIVKISSNTLVESAALNVANSGVVQQESGVYRYEPKEETIVGRQLCTSSTSNGTANHDEEYAATGDVVQVECTSGETVTKGLIYVARQGAGPGTFDLAAADRTSQDTSTGMMFYCNRNQTSSTSPTLYIKAIALVPQNSFINLDTTSGSGSTGTPSGAPLYMGTSGKFEVNIPTTASQYVRHVGYLMERDLTINSVAYCKVYFCPSQDYILLE